MKKQGTLPDIITFDAPMCAKYAMDEFLFDVTSSFSADEPRPFITTNTYQGKLYGLPIQESLRRVLLQQEPLRESRHRRLERHRRQPVGFRHFPKRLRQGSKPPP